MGWTRPPNRRLRERVARLFEKATGAYSKCDLIGIGAAVTHRPLPHHRAYGSVHGGSRSYAVTGQRTRETKRFEVGIGKPDRQGSGSREIPGTKTAASGITRQPRTHSQLQECCPATTWSFPLPPQRSPKPQTNPAN